MDDLLTEVFTRRINCYVFVDDAGESMNRYDAAHTALATRARHRGHNVIFMAQRGSMLSPTVRAQCERAWLFSLPQQDWYDYCQEFCCPLPLPPPPAVRGQGVLLARYAVPVARPFRVDFTRRTFSFLPLTTPRPPTNMIT